MTTGIHDRACHLPKNLDEHIFASSLVGGFRLINSSQFGGPTKLSWRRKLDDTQGLPQLQFPDEMLHGILSYAVLCCSLD